ncbi:hypothetical protein L1049_016784 [Liquidambar formosana]|uniref:Uncharacterized protein n=1 Tax=Liquidambar formosana TaxID=63359 RepID=A0AAP0RZX2_LIQFO
MLCVQDFATCRPTMSAMVLMLESEVVTIPMPREPIFASVSSILESEAVTLPMPRQPIFASVSILESEAMMLPMPRQHAFASLWSSVDMDHGIEGNDRVPHSI